MKKYMIGILIMIVVLLCIIHFTETASIKEDEWHHKTIQGTVVGIWEEGSNIYFSIASQVHENVYNIMISEDTLYCVEFHVGDEVVVEVDYNIREHNGKDRPYIAAMVADAAVHDNDTGLENS